MNRDKTRIDTGMELLESKFCHTFYTKIGLHISLYGLKYYLNIHLDQEDYDDEIQSYASVKRLKGKLKKVPIRMRTTGVNSGNTVQKGLRKIITRNINVTDFDQVFVILFTCIFSFWSQYYNMFIILFLIHTCMNFISSKNQTIVCFVYFILIKF